MLVSTTPGHASGTLQWPSTALPSLGARLPSMLRLAMPMRLCPAASACHHFVATPSSKACYAAASSDGGAMKLEVADALLAYMEAAEKAEAGKHSAASDLPCPHAGS